MRGRVRKWILALPVLVLAAIGVLVARPGRDLLSRANRLTLSDGIITNEATYSGYHYFYHHVPAYYWLSETELLSIREVERGSYETVRINLTAGTIKRQAGRGPFGQSRGSWDELFYWTVSPDGKWMLAVSGKDRDLVYTAKALSGEKHFSWTNEFAGGVEPSWLSDSSGFVEWETREGSNFGRVHWLDSGETSEFNVDAPPREPLNGRNRIEGPLASVAPRMKAAGSVNEFIELAPAHPAANPIRKRLVVSLPGRLRGGDAKVFLSPQGDRLGWLVFFERKIPQLTFSRTYPFINTHPRFSTTLLVSRLDGTWLHPIGYLRPDDEINAMAWTPDGKRLSFVHDQAVWTVPAE